jgi:hypothetical protein
LCCRWGGDAHQRAAHPACAYGFKLGFESVKRVECFALVSGKAGDGVKGG